MVYLALSSLLKWTNFEATAEWWTANRAAALRTQWGAPVLYLRLLKLTNVKATKVD